MSGLFPAGVALNAADSSGGGNQMTRALHKLPPVSTTTLIVALILELEGEMTEQMMDLLLRLEKLVHVTMFHLYVITPADTGHHRAQEPPQHRAAEGENTVEHQQSGSGRRI